MNHFATMLLFILLATLLATNPSSAKLPRKLKNNEIKTLKQNIQRNPANVRSREFLGEHYFNQSDWSAVIEVLEPKSEDLKDPELYYLAVSYYKSSNFRAAEAIVNILLSRKKVDTKSLLLAAEILGGIVEHLDNALLKKNLVDKLVDTLKKAHSLDPKNRKVYRAWLDSVEKFTDHFAHNALPIMEKMKEHEVSFRPSDYSRLCRYNHLAGYSKETQFTCQQAIVKDPKNPSNYIYLGQTNINIGKEEEGKRMLASVGKKFANSEEALWATANSYYESQNLQMAYHYFKKASKHKDALPRDYLGLATTAFELKKYSTALKAFSQHCYMSDYLHHEFRRASGLLSKKPKIQQRFRDKMHNCKPDKGKK